MSTSFLGRLIKTSVFGVVLCQLPACNSSVASGGKSSDGGSDAGASPSPSPGSGAAVPANSPMPSASPGGATDASTTGDTSAIQVIPSASPGVMTSGPALMFQSPPFTQDIGTCGAVPIALTSDGTQPLSATTDVNVTLTSSSSASVFYSDSNCTNFITSVKITTGTSAVIVYYKDSAVGQPTITIASPDNQLAAVTQTEGNGQAAPVVTSTTTTGAGSATPAGAPTQVAMLLSNVSIKVGTCALVALQSQDVSGNTAPVSSAVSIALTTTATNGHFFSDHLCADQITSTSIASGGTDAIVFYSNASTGTETLTATPGAALSVGKQVVSLTN